MDVYSHLLDKIEQKEKLKAVKVLENMAGTFRGRSGSFTRYKQITESEG